MTAPPRSVALVARAHAVVGAVMLASVALLHGVTRGLPEIDWSTRTYAIATGLGGLYVLTGLMVRFGLPPGQLLSRVCGLLYLARPQFGSPLWDLMSQADFKAHFRRSRKSVPPDEEVTGR